MFKLYILAASLLLFLAALEAREVCYSDLGCFRDTYPFGNSIQRPLSFLPESPEQIAPVLRLYNPNTNTGNELLSADFLGDVFNASLQTKFIIHGFLHHARKDWVIQMKDALLATDKMNVITVDWSKGNGFPYTQATANTQVVGAMLAKLIKNLCDKKGSQPADFHLIGHSLGAHIAGYVGERVIGLGKITGLDPGKTYLSNFVCSNYRYLLCIKF
jgi:pancreatic triacylglycerol lipase